MEGDSRKRVHAKFYVEPDSCPPSEPVRDWLRSLPKDEMQEIGRDIRVGAMSWPRVQDVSPRLVDYLGGDLWEVRAHLRNRIARVLFSVETGGIMIDLALARLKRARRSVR